MLEKFQKMIEDLKEQDKKQKEILHIEQLFNMQDYAKELLHNSTTDIQVASARSFLNRINEEMKMLYIPTANENV